VSVLTAQQLALFWRYRLWAVRYAIQRALGLECEWQMLPRREGPMGSYRARCRWCGGYMRRDRPRTFLEVV
jgi:hypothetical protein